MPTFNQSFTASLGLLGFRVNSVKAATTGYANDVADWTDTTPQPDSSDSGSKVLNPSSQVSFIWPTFVMAPGIILTSGDARNVYIKSFEDQTAPRLSMAGVLTTLQFVLLASLTFAASLLLSAQLLRGRSQLMLAVMAFHGSMSKRTMSHYNGTVNFVTSLVELKQLLLQLLTSSLSFVGNLNRRTLKSIASAVSFVADLVRRFNNTVFFLLTASVSFAGTILSHRTVIVLLQSLLLLRGSFASGWVTLRTFIYTTVRLGLQWVAGLVSGDQRVSGYVTFPKTTQTIGTIAQLIDLSDFTAPPEALFIKNENTSHFVEIDTSSSFDKFPQRIPPEKAVVLSPNTTTIYARGIGAAVNISLMPGLPARQHRLRLTSNLRFSTTLST